MSNAVIQLVDKRVEVILGPGQGPAGGKGDKGDRGFDGSGGISAIDVGAVGDGVTDDYIALQAWLDLGGHLYLPAGHYYCSQQLVVRKHVNVQGIGYAFDRRATSLAAMAGSRIRFPAGVGGIQVQTAFALATGETILADMPASMNAATVQEGGFHSTFRDLILLSDSAGAGAGIGFDARVLVHLDNVTCNGFGDEGFLIQGSSDIPDAPIPYGNASLSTLKACHAVGCGSHGFWQRGRDAGPVHYDTCDAISNSGWGFLNNALYGALYSSPHAASNALGAYKNTSMIGGSTYVMAYFEVGFGANSDLPANCTIIGGILAVDNNGNTNTSPAGKIGFGVSSLELFRSAYGNLNGSTTYPLSNEAYYYHHSSLGAVVAGNGAGNDITLVNSAGATVLSVVAGTTNANFAGTVHVQGNQVVGPRGAAVADATDAASAITQLNALLARMRAHGLIA